MIDAHLFPYPIISLYQFPLIPCFLYVDKIYSSDDLFVIR